MTPRNKEDENMNGELQLTINHTAITVSDLSASMAWYQKMLGFTPEKTFERQDMGAKIGFMTLNKGLTSEYHLELFSFKDYEPLPDYRKQLASDLHTVGTKHFALGVENIDEAFHVLSKRGVTFDSKPTIGGSGHRYTFFRDLDGIMIELFENSPYER